VSLLDIRVLGDPILRQETVPVTEVTDELRRLIDGMFETMYAAKGIGLAAPQVGRTERLTVIDVDEEPLVLINPEIVLAEGKIKGEEGCLSIPEIYGDVERAGRVVVRALDRDGKQFEIEGEELLSRCLQHEIDHLHGKLFIDYLSVLKRRSAMSKWAKEKDKYPGNVRRLSASEVARHHHRDEEL
jgi:peptide deformylase